MKKWGITLALDFFITHHVIKKNSRCIQWILKSEKK